MIRFLESDMPLKLRARWVFPVDGPPLQNGLVEIDRGIIVGLSNRPDPCAVDLGNVAIVPGLVNAHTHLELSDCAAPLSPMRPFTEWIRAVMAHRRHRSAETLPAGTDPTTPVGVGAMESSRLGTTCLGDIVGPDWRPEAVPADGPLVLAFREILGLNPERIPTLLEQARNHLALARQCEQTEGDNRRQIAFGLSPHAPYSVHPDLLRGLVDLARQNNVLVAMHLAETEAELQLLSACQGEFVDFLKQLGVWNDDAFRHSRSILDCLKELARAPRGLVVHGNFLSADDISFLEKETHLSVVYCPRTHAGFQHPPHPWKELLSRGVTLAIGTDSRASNPDLSVWNELQFLQRLDPTMFPGALLELGTINGARALGMDGTRGTITPGKSADLTMIELSSNRGADPYATLFDPANRVRGGIQQGRWQRQA